MQKPGHRKNPAAVALGRLGGLAGRGKAKARKVTSEMARRAVLARWAKARLLLFFLGLLAPVAYSQGTLYTYTFSGDTSPLNVTATFTATEQAVATGFLAETNILSSSMRLGDGRTAPIFRLTMPVTSYGGWPIGYPGYTKAFASFGLDMVEIDGGYLQDTHPAVVSWPWVGSPQFYPSKGSWSVSVPEPASPLLLLAFFLVRPVLWPRRLLLMAGARAPTARPLTSPCHGHQVPSRNHHPRASPPRRRRIRIRSPFGRGF